MSGQFMVLNEMTRDEVRELAPQMTLVLPTAATEQHGPHLPLKTDCAIGEAIARRAAELAADDSKPDGLETGRPTADKKGPAVCLAPLVPFGNSQHHLIYSALSLRTETYMAVLHDLLDCAVKAGFRRIFVLNAHGGNDECVRLAGRDLVLRPEAVAAGVAFAACSYWTVAQGAAREAGVGKFGNFPGHAGNFETSLMMALAPDLVRHDRFPKDAGHPAPINYAGLTPPGLLVQKSGDWQRVGGYTEAPLLANEEDGRRFIELIAVEVAKAIVAFHRATAG